ncbi:MAG: hypothetical protein RBT34_03235 [Anaerolineaceae bacterium]|jgi:hypothetical protein|nr:hypothetical protein [Anaerolineaceae bacterium]
MNQKMKRPLDLPTIFIVVVPLLLLGKTIFGGRALYWGLPALQFVPWQAYAWEQLRGGMLPLWNDLNGMGAPLLANYQLGIFYPPSWLLYACAAVGGVRTLAWANTVLVYLHLVWAGLGMVRLVREIGGKSLAQTIAALAFSLSGFFVARAGFFSILWAAAWMPWIVVYASRIASPVRKDEAPGSRGVFPVPLILCVTAMLLAGHAQISWYIALYAALWVFGGAMVHYGWKEAIFSLVRLGVSFGTAAMVSAVQLLPTAEYLMLSQRTSAVDYETAMAYSFWPWRFITFVAPNFFGNPGQGNYWGYASFHEDGVYMGLLPFLLALMTVAAQYTRKKQGRLGRMAPLARFLRGVNGIGMIWGLGKFTPIFPFLFKHVPTFDMFNGPVRIMVWVVFSLALLAAVATEILWRRPVDRGLYWTRLATAGGVAVTIGAFLGWYFLREVNVTFIQATAFAGLWGVGAGILTLLLPIESTNAKRRLMWMVAAAVWVSVDLLAAGWWINPDIDLRFYAQQSQESELSNAVGHARVYQSLSDNYRLKFNRFVRLKNYRPIEPVSTMREIGLPNINLLDGVSSANNFDPFSPQRHAEWMDMLDDLPEEELNSWLALMNVSIYQRVNPEAPRGVDYLPVDPRERLELVSCVNQVQTGEAAWQMIKEMIADEKDYCAVIEADGHLEQFAANPNGGIILLEDAPGRMALSVSSASGGWLVLRDTWYPGWVGRVDGERVEIYKADFLFRAVPVPAGEHLVEFKYRPKSFTIGVIFSMIGVAAILYLAWKMKPAV